MLGYSAFIPCVGSLRLSANQTTNLANNNRIQWDVNELSSGWASLITSGSEVGTINLNAPGRYLILSQVRATGTNVNATLQWYNKDSATYIGKRTRILGANQVASSVEGMAPLSSVWVNLLAGTPAIPIELRVVSGGGSMTNWLTDSWAFIHRM